LEWPLPFPLTPQKAESQPHLLRSLSAPTDQKGWQQLLETARPSSTQAERRAGRANSLQSKARAAVQSGDLECRLASITITKSFTSFRAPSPIDPGRESNSQPHSSLNTAFSLCNQGTCIAHSIALCTVGT